MVQEKESKSKEALSSLQDDSFDIEMDALRQQEKDRYQDILGEINSEGRIMAPS